MRHLLPIVVILAARLALAGSARDQGGLAEDGIGTEEEFMALWEQAGEEARQMRQSFPQIPVELDLQLGFQYFDIEGAKRVTPYHANSPYPFAELQGSCYRQAFRVFGDARFDSPSDYSADVAFRALSLLSFRAFVTATRANLERHGLVSLSPNMGDPLDSSTPRDPAFTVRDEMSTSPEPFANSVRMQGEARLLAPSYPAKLYARYWVFDRSSGLDEHLLAGSGYFDAAQRLQLHHLVHTRYLRLESGVNGHLGPVELEYAHEEMRFQPLSSPSLVTYDYGPQRGASFAVREMASLHGRRDVARLHSAANGRLYLSATVQRESRTNENTNVTGTIDSIFAAMRYNPATRFSLGATYTLRRSDYSTPGVLVLSDESGQGLDQSYEGVRPVSGMTQVVRGQLTYRPTRWLWLEGEWRHQDRRRDNAGQWHVARRTIADTATGYVSARLGAVADVSGRYRYEATDSPAYNWEPTETHRGTATLRLRPLPLLSLMGSYELARHRRQQLVFTVPSTTVTTGQATVVSQNVFATATITEASSTLSVSYSYQQIDNQQTALYWDFTLASEGCAAGEVCGYIEDAVTYVAESHLLTATLDHAVTEDLSLGGQCTYATGLSELEPTRAEAATPLSIGSLSRRRLQQTRFGGYVRYAVGSGWAVRLSGSAERLRFDTNPYDSSRGGRALMLAVSVLKGW